MHSVNAPSLLANVDAVQLGKITRLKPSGKLVRSFAKGIVNMQSIPMIVTTVFAVCCMAALTPVSGCSEPGTRTLTLFQYQSTKTSIGAFRIDTSEIPPEAIESQTETGVPGKPETRLTLNSDFEFEIVVRLVSKK